MSRASNGGEILTIRLNRTVGYWTDERLREAMSNPIELSVENMNSTRRKRDGHVWTEEEIRSSSPLDTDVSLDTLRAMGIEPNDITMFDVELSPKNVADINEYPFNNYGKLFINSQHGGGHCSAAFVRERVLITAAHCIRRENGDWYEHFRFYQRFNGIEDQGRIVEVEKPFIYSNYINDEGGMELK